MAADMAKCRITVLRRGFDKDLIHEFVKDPEGFVPCEKFGDGQVFILDNALEMPEGFCSWAWGDLRGDVLALATGSNFPWMKQPGTSIMACSDCFRPVVFKLERLS
jgi:uncharacterized repeat protein (TIGR04076 family)